MTTRQFLATVCAAACLALSACNDGKKTGPSTVERNDPAANVNIGKELFAPAEYRATAAAQTGADPITVPLANVVILRKLDLPSKVDGTVKWIGVEINEAAAAGLRTSDVFHHPRDKKVYRRLQPGDFVKRDQVVTLLDDEIAFIKNRAAATKLEVSKTSSTEYGKTVQQLRELRNQVRIGVDRGVVPAQELYSQEATLARYAAEWADKKGAVELAAAEANEAQFMLDRHLLKPDIDGEIHQVIKKEGDGVKATEPVLVIHDLRTLRALGNLPKEYVSSVSRGDDVTVEIPRDYPPETTFTQHTTNKAIVAVAVAVVGGKPIIISVAEDGWVFVWDRDMKVLGSSRMSVGIRSLAVTRPGVEPALALAGGVDGTARLYNLSKPSAEPMRIFEGRHDGGVTAAAFSPDGRYCVTADERGIYMNNVADGKRMYSFPVREHNSAITALSFTPQGRVVSAGREPAIRVWQVGDTGAKIEHRIDSRSGDVALPGVTDDGSRLLVDANKTHLDVIHLKDLSKERPLMTAGESARFATFAAWSPELGKKPDHRLIATTGGIEGVVQMWRAPTAQVRGAEIARLNTRDGAAATCAAFNPLADDGFIVVGTKKGDVHLWPLPAADAQTELKSTVTHVENTIESSGRTVQVLVDVDNPKIGANKYLLRPGSTVNLVIHPKK